MSGKKAAKKHGASRTLRLPHDYETAVERSVSVLKSKGVLLYPTDTVYGLGGDATDEGVVRRINRLKGSDEEKPLSVVMANFDMIKEYCGVGGKEMELLRYYLPGPYTFIIRCKKRLPAMGKAEKLGIRIPGDVFTRRLCEEFGKPITSTSANLSGKGAANSVQGVHARIMDGADLVLDGGKTNFGLGSTIIDLSARKTVREGAGKFEWRRFARK
ncbi:MAG: L-threonylcarbamoyladenylate synthase [Candidatus Bilamarchaeaceae archaeon]